MHGQSCSDIKDHFYAQVQNCKNYIMCKIVTTHKNRTDLGIIQLLNEGPGTYGLLLRQFPVCILYLFRIKRIYFYLKSGHRFMLPPLIPNIARQIFKNVLFKKKANKN